MKLMLALVIFLDLFLPTLKAQTISLPPPKTLTAESYLRSFDSREDETIGVGLLPGQFEIEFASVRPAPRACYLLYAAALDQYATLHADLLASNPVLGRMVRSTYFDNHAIFVNYSNRLFHYASIVEPAGEAAILRNFLKTGYNGRLRPEIDAYLVELDKAAKAEASKR